MKKKITKKELITKLKITSQAVTQWKKNGIPAQACIDIEGIIGVPARKLQNNPHLLFDMFNNTPNTPNKSTKKA